MKTDEAIALRQAHLHGQHVDQRLLDRALRQINLGNSIAAGHSDTWKPEPMHEAQRQRGNCVLAYNLALALGKFNDWKEQR